MSFFSEIASLFLEPINLLSLDFIRIQNLTFDSNQILGILFKFNYTPKNLLQ